MKKNRWSDLQFFAEEGAAAVWKNDRRADPGVEAAAPGQNGENLNEQRGGETSSAARGRRSVEPVRAQTAAGKSVLAALSRENPALKRELERLIRERVKSFAQARDSLKTLQPALELLARSYGQNVENGLDFEALAQAVQEDGRYRTAAQADTERQFRAHVGKLVRQAEELKQTIPDFDLKRELSDEKFRRFTSPEIGMSVKDAYYALHYDELRQAESALIAQRAEREIANKIAAGQLRPREGGGRAPSVGGLARTSWTRAEIESIKREAMEARARGEKYYIE